MSSMQAKQHLGRGNPAPLPSNWSFSFAAPTASRPLAEDATSPLPTVSERNRTEVFANTALSPASGMSSFAPTLIRAPASSIQPSFTAAVESIPRTWSPPPETPIDNVKEDVVSRPSLSDYVKNRRDLLDIIKELHSTGIQNELDLPQIVVIGSQSVGKSSLIESMSGISLPRDTGTCTRCPMECRLQHATLWSCKVVLRFQYDLKSQALSEVREVPFGPVLYKREEVQETLRRAQRAILRPALDAKLFLDDSDLNTPGERPLTFSGNCVCIRVAGPTVPDLFFYDLPGIITNVGDGGDEADMVLIENLAKGYISRRNCIVLLVISCETDFENQKAGALVLRNSLVRQRTVGVLTKVDRIEAGAGASAKWLKILSGEESILQKGWFAVKQPDLVQLQAGISWEDARASESEFFANTAPWSNLDGRDHGRLGSESLSEHLGTILSELVSRELPTIQRKVTEQLHAVDNELQDMPAPDTTDPRKEIITLLRDFNKKLSKHIDGATPDLSPSLDDVTSVTAQGLINRLHGLYEQFRINVQATAPQFRPWSSQQDLDTAEEKVMMTSLKKVDETAKTTSDARVFYLDEVVELARRTRSRELPGNFPFEVKEKLILQSVRKWKDISTECFTEVSEVVLEYLKDLIEEHFGKYSYGGLKNTVRDVAVDVIQKRAQETAGKIRALQTSEETPYTQNEHYFFDYHSKLLRRYKMVYGLLSDNSHIVGVLQSYPATKNIGPHTVKCETDQCIDNVISNLASLGLHGIVAEDIAKLLPDNQMTTGLEIMAEVRAYFQVAYKRFADNVPKQIDTDFIRGTDNDLDYALRSLDLNHDQCLKWLQEPSEITLRRKELSGRKKRLESAKERLANYYHSRESSFGSR